MTSGYDIYANLLFYGKHDDITRYLSPLADENTIYPHCRDTLRIVCSRYNEAFILTLDGESVGVDY